MLNSHARVTMPKPTASAACPTIAVSSVGPKTTFCSRGSAPRKKEPTFRRIAAGQRFAPRRTKSSSKATTSGRDWKRPSDGWPGSSANTASTASTPDRMRAERPSPRGNHFRHGKITLARDGQARHEAGVVMAQLNLAAEQWEATPEDRSEEHTSE